MNNSDIFGEAKHRRLLSSGGSETENTKAQLKVYLTLLPL